MKIFVVAFEASEVNVEIGKHEFKSCEGTASNPDYGWRNGAKFTKIIFIHIQCSY